MINRIWIVIVLVLSGCASTQEPIRVSKVPEPPLIVVPPMPIETLTKESAPNEVAQAYFETVIRLRALLEEALVALDAYRK